MENGFFDVLCLYWPVKAQRGETQISEGGINIHDPLHCDSNKRITVQFQHIIIEVRTNLTPRFKVSRWAKRKESVEVALHPHGRSRSSWLMRLKWSCAECYIRSFRALTALSWQAVSYPSVSPQRSDQILL